MLDDTNFPFSSGSGLEGDGGCYPEDMDVASLERALDKTKNADQRFLAIAEWVAKQKADGWPAADIEYEVGRATDARYIPRKKAMEAAEHGYDLWAGVQYKKDLDELNRRLKRAPKKDRRADVVRAKEIQPEPITWIWQHRIARGKQCLIGGDPGIGKSQLGVYLAAQISRGGLWPDGTRAPLGSVIVLTAEDGLGDTVVPRLIAADADMDRIYFYRATEIKDGRRRMFSLSEDLDALEDLITEIGDVVAIILDPASAYFGSKNNSWRDTDVRSVLGPVSDLAERMNVAIISIAHLTKAGNQQAKMRFLGSVAFVAAVRSAYLVVEEHDQEGRHSGRLLFLEAKTNIGPKQRGLGYRLLQSEIGRGIIASYVDWDNEPVMVTADQALAAASGAQQSGRPAQDEAKEFLRKVLAHGPVAVKEIEEQAEGAGISWATIRRAKTQLMIDPQKGGMKGGWFWQLPKLTAATEGAHEDAEDAQL